MQSYPTIRAITSKKKKKLRFKFVLRANRNAFCIRAFFTLARIRHETLFSPLLGHRFTGLVEFRRLLQSRAFSYEAEILLIKRGAGGGGYQLLYL